LRAGGGSASAVSDVVAMHDRCDGCGEAPVDLGPMLHDDIWRQIAEPAERALCIKCMIDRTFERLGRFSQWLRRRRPGDAC
jgi:hypothetical protein